MNKRHLPIVTIAVSAALALTSCLTLPEPIPHELPAAWSSLPQHLKAAGKPGAALASFDISGTVQTGAWGWADIEERRPVGLDTPFIIGSVSKLVVGIVVMRLAEEGRIGLDEDVSVQLGRSLRNPRFPDIPITVRLLLTHRSGILNDWPGALYGMLSPADPPEPDTALQRFVDGYLLPGGTWYKPGNFASWKPGEGFEYSNPGICLAARIAELATGRPFAALSRELVFSPLGMESTFWFAAERPGAWERTALPYAGSGSIWFPKGRYTALFYPAGFLKTTAGDLGRLGACMLRGGDLDGNRILGRETVAAMLTPVPGPAPVNWREQGLVWQCRTVEDRELVGHTGGLDGISSLFMLDRRTGRGALVLCNGDWQPGTGYDRMAEAPMRRIILELLATGPAR